MIETLDPYASDVVDAARDAIGGKCSEGRAVAFLVIATDGVPNAAAALALERSKLVISYRSAFRSASWALTDLGRSVLQEVRDTVARKRRALGPAVRWTAAQGAGFDLPWTFTTPAGDVRVEQVESSYVITGPTGRHALAVEPWNTQRGRLIAHTRVFVEANGGKFEDPAAEPVCKCGAVAVVRWGDDVARCASPACFRPVGELPADLDPITRDHLTLRAQVAAEKVCGKRAHVVVGVDQRFRHVVTIAGFELWGPLGFDGVGARDALRLAVFRLERAVPVADVEREANEQAADDGLVVVGSGAWERITTQIADLAARPDAPPWVPVIGDVIDADDTDDDEHLSEPCQCGARAVTRDGLETALCAACFDVLDTDDGAGGAP